MELEGTAGSSATRDRGNGFDSEIKKANNPSATNNKLYAVATIGRDSAESGALKKKIEKNGLLVFLKKILIFPYCIYQCF